MLTYVNLQNIVETYQLETVKYGVNSVKVTLVTFDMNKLVQLNTGEILELAIDTNQLGPQQCGGNAVNRPVGLNQKYPS